MQKNLVIASLLFVSHSVLIAQEMDNNWFIGSEFGTFNMKTKNTVTILGFIHSEKDTLNTTYEALKIGKNFEFGRLYGSLGKQNEKDDFSSYTVGLGYDYLFKNKSEFTPFIGLNASYTKGKVGDANAVTLSLDKPKGFNYSIEAGILYGMTKNVELEIGLRYILSNVDDTSIQYTPFIYDPLFIQNSSYSVKLEGENITQYYLGLNYKF